VPATINYRLVLEAETLIEDYLAETGKSRYIITDDEFSRLGRIVEFVRKILVHEGAVVIRFGRPLDPLGHDVDDDGRSLDRPAGWSICAATSSAPTGSIAPTSSATPSTPAPGPPPGAGVPARVGLPRHHRGGARGVRSAVRAAGTRDIYRLTRLPPGREVPVADVIAGLGALRAQLAARPEAGRLHHRVAAAGDAATLDDAVRALGTYHRHPVLERRATSCGSATSKLLYYYQNRLAHLPVEVVRDRARATPSGSSAPAASAPRSRSRWPGPAARSCSTPAPRRWRQAIAATRRCPRLPDVEVPEAVRVVESTGASWRRPRGSW
jgi:glycerol-3-phosphate O-acyltransferase